MATVDAGAISDVAILATYSLGAKSPQTLPLSRSPLNPWPSQISVSRINKNNTIWGLSVPKEFIYILSEIRFYLCRNFLGY